MMTNITVTCEEGYLDATTFYEALENYEYLADECGYDSVEIYDNNANRFYSRAQLEDLVQFEIAITHGEL